MGAEMVAEIAAEIGAEIGADFFLNKIRLNLENMYVIDVPPVPNSQPHRRQFRRQFRLPVHKFRRHFGSISARPERRTDGRAAADAGQKQRLPAAQPGSRGNTRAAIAKQVKATRRRPNLLNETDTHSTK